MKTENAVHAAVLKAFCDENRLTILQMLCTGEKCACRLQSALAIGQSTLSHHMKQPDVVVQTGKRPFGAADHTTEKRIVCRPKHRQNNENRIQQKTRNNK